MSDLMAEWRDEAKERLKLFKQTQSILKPGNCWQTAIACVLGVNADQMPQQVPIENEKRSYLNALNAYLFTHHDGSAYVEVEGPAVQGVVPVGYHIIIGETERTPALKEEAKTDSRVLVLHAVVGCDGQQCWDPHPSRAGLTRILRWGLLVHLEGEDHDRRKSIIATGKMVCHCAACGGLKPKTQQEWA